MTGLEAQWALQNERAEETRRLRRNALFVGVSLLAILAVETAAGLVLGAPLTRAEAAMDSSTAARLTYYALYSLYYCLMLLVPVGVVALIFRRSPLPRQGQTAPKQRLTAAEAALWIAFGMAFCVLANYLVNYWLQAISVFGVEPYEGDYHNEGGWLPLALNLFTYALLPALVEELVFRGWLLSALRPFGERRALLLSALIFGLMHGNLTQVPFALLLGLLFGFLALRTGRLWLGMAIHLLNNAMSVLLDYVSVTMGLTDNQLLLVQMAVFVTLAAAGTTAALVLRYRREPHNAAASARPLIDHRSVLTASSRARLMWFSPTVIISLVLLAGITVAQELLL